MPRYLSVSSAHSRGMSCAVALACEQQAFDFVANHDVQRVGELIGLDANGRGLRDVHGAVQVVFGHAAVDGGHAAAQDLQQRAHERPAAAHGVLAEARLALVDAHGCAARQAGVGVCRVDAQLVHGVARLVDDRVHVRYEVVLIYMRGDARVAHREALGEGGARWRRAWCRRGRCPTAR